MENISAHKAAKLLGISIDNLHLLEKEGLIHSFHDDRGEVFYFNEELQRIKSRRGPSISEEAALVNVGIEREVVSSVSFTKKVLIFVAGILTGYAFLVGVFTILFVTNPLPTARWLGIIRNNLSISIAQGSDPRVLGAETSIIKEASTPIQTLLQPIGRVSLGIAKTINPSSYEQISQVTILDANDVLEIDGDGSITPARPISLPVSSLLQVGDTGLVDNLNSQYLQGKQPGTNVGDIAIIGDDGQIAGIESPATPARQVTTIIQNVIATPVPSAAQPTTGLTNANLSGSAGITNANLANSLIKFQAGTGITLSGSSVSLGDSITIIAEAGGGAVSEITGTANQVLVSSPTGAITLSLPQSIGLSSAPSFSGMNLTNTLNQLVFGAVNTGTLSWTPTASRVLTLPDASDTLMGRATTDTLTNKTMNAGLNFISGLTAVNLTAGDFSSKINSGTYSIDVSGSAGSVTGAFAGDVTGTQGATVLKNTGTAGTYGTALNIPVFVTDAQGRVTSVTNTTISGLTNTHLSGSAGITNANLANSSLSLAGNSGSGSVALGGTLTVTGSGISNVDAAGSTLTITSTEADTLQSVYERGNTITTTTGRNIAFTLPSGLLTPTSMTLTNNGTADSLLVTDAANTNFGANTRRSLLINPGAITQNTGGATGVYSGLDITLPALTLTSGTALTANGIRVTTDGITQTTGALTSNGLLVDSTSSTITTGGTINGVRINGPTTAPAVGTYNNLFLGTSTGSTANTYDSATIAVGDISSTATQNFSTLNIKNGGSGYLDVELIRGFINFQNMNTLYEDFTSKALDTADRWSSTSTGTGSNCSILAGGLNGLFRMHSGAGINRGCELTTQAITTLADGYYQRGNNPIFETKLKVDTVTNARVFVGFTEERVPITSDTNPDTNHAYIAKRSTDSTWQCVTDDGGATETVTDTGVTIVANTFYRLRVELRSGTTPQTICTIDNGTTVTRTVVSATQPSATTPMDVYLKLNQSDTVSKNMDVDYVRAWQDDPPVEGLAAIGNTSNEQDIPEVDEAFFEEASESAELTPESPQVLSTESMEDSVVNLVKGLLNSLVEFFGKVIFHDDVSFFGRTTFNTDTAGHALIKAGDGEVSINFEREYVKNPVVTTSINLVAGIQADEVPSYAVYDTTTKGFTIKLTRPASLDLYFSWVALGVNDDSVSGDSRPTEMSENKSDHLEVSPTPTVASTPTPIEEPIVTPKPILTESETPVATDSATLAP